MRKIEQETSSYEKKFNKKTSNFGVREKFDKQLQQLQRQRKLVKKHSASEEVYRNIYVRKNSEKLHPTRLHHSAQRSYIASSGSVPWQRHAEALENRFWLMVD